MEETHRKKRTPFYLRWQLWAPVAVVAVAVLLGLIAFQVIRAGYNKRAGVFDLADVERMESATLIYDRDGTQVGKIFIQNRNPIPYAQIPKLMVEAIVAAEDNRFWDHDGVDYWGIVRAALKNYQSGKIKQGASTVTQQLARNSYELRERSYDRKLLEMAIANRIEKKYSKDKIMELYLNRVYFGSGLYGVDAAARGYFGVPARELTAGQCAMLAGLLKSPNGLSPWNNPEGAKGARNFVLERMKDQGFISSTEMRSEQDSLLVTRRRMNPYKVSYAVDYVRQQAIAALGYDRAMNGGFRIYTTLDVPMQRAAETALRNVLNQAEARPAYNHQTYGDFALRFKPFDDALRAGGFPSTQPPAPEYLQGAVIAYDNNTGGILALVGGREFKHSEYNRALQARRPTGTAFAPLVFAAAYEKGFFPGEIVQDAALDNRYVNIGGTTGILGEWGVERPDNEYEGGIPAREALVKSKNGATVRVGWEAGLDSVKALVKKAGITSEIRDFSNAFLGTSEVSLDELTLAYTMFPGKGWRPKQSHIIQKILDAEGNVVYQADPGKIPVIKDSTAFQVHAGLDEALHSGTGAAALTQFGLGQFPAGGKTGTAYDFTDTYFVGYTSAVTCGVWVGFDKPAKIYRGAFGSQLALPVWTETINASAADFAPGEFKRPESVSPVSICRASGLLETGRCEHETVDPATGAKRMQKSAYIEYATEAQKPHIPCDIHGTGVRTYARNQDESEWPRASLAVDLAMIRPVAVSAPALIGLNDVYNSIRPAALRMSEDEIPVAKAIPVDQQVAQAAMAEGEAATAVAAVPEAPREVRKAEAVKPLDLPKDASAITLDPPKPIRF